jgi:radical SAM protein (TIGR01212 family)
MHKTISEVLKTAYGQKIYKLSLSAGCTCPNRDGKISTGGCTFCSEGGSGDFAAPCENLNVRENVESQIEFARKLVDNKIPARIRPEDRKYIAYFQSYTNTYGNVDRLRELYTMTIERHEIVILSLGTRPDCLEDDKIRMLKDLNRIKPVWVELGLQTSKEETARRIRRGYELPVFTDAFQRLKEAGLTVIVHVIFGLPGESREDMLNTIRFLSRTLEPGDGIKIQLLHVLKNTRLYEEYQKKPFHILTLDEYCDLVHDAISLLPEDIIIHRLTGDGPKSLLVEPKWSGNKKMVLNTMRSRLKDLILI